MSDYFKSSFDRAQREYDNQLPPEFARPDDDFEIAPPGGSDPEQKEFERTDWKSDIARDDEE